MYGFMNAIVVAVAVELLSKYLGILLSYLVKLAKSLL